MARLTPNEYCEYAWRLQTTYIEGVLSGNIVSGSYLKKAIQKFLDMQHNPMYIYRDDKVNKVFKFFSFLNISHKDHYQQFKLINWQAFLISAVYGFYYKDKPENRVVREVLTFIARKNGKTAFVAALQLYSLVADGIDSPQAILLANTASQASLCLSYAKGMVSHTPELRKMLIGQRSRIIFKDYGKQGFAQVFSSVEPARLDGLNVSFAVIDESHNYDNSDILNVMRTGTGARLNPLIVLITTAGSKNKAFLAEYVNQHKNILDQTVTDDTMFSLLYMPDVGDKLGDPTVWVKSNPSLDIINSSEHLKMAFEKAKHSFSDKYAFFTKHLNVFFDDAATWIPEEYLRPLFIDFDEYKYRGRECWIGMDLSKTSDMSSIVMTIPIPEEKITYVVPYFWLADRQENLIRKNGRDLMPWISSGHIIKCDSKTIDMNLIYEKIISIAKDFDVISIQYDPYNSFELITRLKEYGLNCEIYKQNASKFNGPLKLIEEMVYNKRLILKNNPVLLNNFANIILYVDQNANIKINKNKQSDYVDGCVSLAMSIGGYLENRYGSEVMGLTSYVDTIRSIKN